MEIAGQPLSNLKIGPISQRSLKSNEKVVSARDPCELIDLSDISPSGWTIFGIHWKITKRSLGDRWDHWVFIKHSLSVHWAVIEKPLPLAIIERLCWTESKLCGDHGDQGDQYTIIERLLRNLGDRWVLFERLLRDLAILSSLNDFSTITTHV